MWCSLIQFKTININHNHNHKHNNNNDNNNNNNNNINNNNSKIHSLGNQNITMLTIQNQKDIGLIQYGTQSRKLMKCFLHPDLKLDRLVIVCKFDGISSQRRGSEINMELKKEEVLEDWCKSLVTTNLLC